MKGSLRVAIGIEVFYFVVLTVSLFSKGLVFSVDAANHYSREAGFRVYMLMHYAGIAYLLFNTLEMAQNFQNRGRKLVYALAGFLAVGTLVQVLIPSVHITWLCVTLIAVLFFLYCNEMWNQLDGLTGLLSQKSYLNRTLNLRAEDKMLIVFDVDDFKNINDTYGHDAGDEVLKAVAELFMDKMKTYGRVCRWGGEEFLFVFYGRNGDAAYDVLQEIYDEIHRLTVSYENEEIRITMTFGLEEYDKNDGMEMAIRRADEKLYQGKETGRDKIVY